MEIVPAVLGEIEANSIADAKTKCFTVFPFLYLSQLSVTAR